MHLSKVFQSACLILVLFFPVFGLIFTAYSQWHTDWPLASNNVRFIKQAYISNLVEAVEERAFAVFSAEGPEISFSYTVDVVEDDGTTQQVVQVSAGGVTNNIVNTYMVTRTVTKTNYVGRYFHLNQMAEIDSTIKSMVPYYVDYIHADSNGAFGQYFYTNYGYSVSNSLGFGPHHFPHLTLTGLWDRLNIGTTYLNQVYFTEEPPRTHGPNTLGYYYTVLDGTNVVLTNSTEFRSLVRVVNKEDVPPPNFIFHPGFYSDTLPSINIEIQGLVQTGVLSVLENENLTLSGTGVVGSADNEYYNFPLLQTPLYSEPFSTSGIYGAVIEVQSPAPAGRYVFDSSYRWNHPSREALDERYKVLNELIWYGYFHNPPLALSNQRAGGPAVYTSEVKRVAVARTSDYSVLVANFGSSAWSSTNSAAPLFRSGTLSTQKYLHAVRSKYKVEIDSELLGRQPDIDIYIRYVHPNINSNFNMGGYMDSDNILDRSDLGPFGLTSLTPLYHIISAIMQSSTNLYITPFINDSYSVAQDSGEIWSVTLRGHATTNQRSGVRALLKWDGTNGFRYLK